MINIMKLEVIQLVHICIGQKWPNENCSGCIAQRFLYAKQDVARNCVRLVNHIHVFYNRSLQNAGDENSNNILALILDDTFPVAFLPDKL